MRTNPDKDTVAVLIHIPKNLYNEYHKTLTARGLKRQQFSSQLFCDAIESEIADFKKRKKNG